MKSIVANSAYNTQKFDPQHLTRAYDDPEPYWDDVAPHIEKLSAIIARIDEKIEGNLYYRHDIDIAGTSINQGLVHKRRLFARYAQTGESLLEIGFNAGHSCLLSLIANPSLKYFGIDIGVHKYTAPCFGYLSEAFPGRVQLLIANSLVGIPVAAASYSFRPDIIHIDGGHGLDVALADIMNCIHHLPSAKTFLFDDTVVPGLQRLLETLILSCVIQPIDVGEDWRKLGSGAFKILR